MKKVIALTMLALISTACLNSSGGGKGSQAGNGHNEPNGPGCSTGLTDCLPEEAPMDDYVPSEEDHRCGGATETSPFGEWIAEDPLHDEPYRRVLVLDIGSRQMTFTALCEYLGYTPLEAKVSSLVKVGNGVIQIYGQDSDNVVEDINGQYMTCDIAIEPAKLRYSFYRSCLVIHQGADKIYMIRSR